MTHQQALDTMAAERYLLDEMTVLEKHAFEEHFFDCSDCATEVRLGERIRVEVRSVRNLDSKTIERSARDSNVIEFNTRPAWRRPLILLPW